MPTEKKSPTEEEAVKTRIRIAEVYTPSPNFEGARERVRFVNGKASLPEPHPDDFASVEDYEREHAGWNDIVWAFEHNYGYDIAYRYITVEDAPVYEPQAAKKRR